MLEVSGNFVSDLYKKLSCRLGFPASCPRNRDGNPLIHGNTAAANNSVRAVGYQVVFPDSPNIMPEDLYFIQSKIGSEIFRYPVYFSALSGYNENLVITNELS